MYRVTLTTVAIGALALAGSGVARADEASRLQEAAQVIQEQGLEQNRAFAEKWRRKARSSEATDGGK